MGAHDSTLNTLNIKDGDSLRVLVLGATGTAGRATTHALVRAGHNVTCLVRHSVIQAHDLSVAHRANKEDPVSGHLNTDKSMPGEAPSITSDPSGAQIRTQSEAQSEAQLETQSGDESETAHQRLNLPPSVQLRTADVTCLESIQRDGFCGEHFDAVISCLASRNGAPADAWTVDYKANVNVLTAAKRAGVQHMVLLSAICVQRPRLIFQRAKLAFEQELIASGIIYTIVRPTAFFKSLSGQIERVKKGKPFLLFGNGTLTACKPISDYDLGNYMAQCLTHPGRHNQILPIGGPGEAITPREQGEQLFAMTGKEPRFIKIPIAIVNAIRFMLETAGKLSSTIADKAEFARIAHYYATESMLVFDHETEQYNADATPSTGTQTLFEFYQQVLDGKLSVERGEHAVFKE